MPNGEYIDLMAAISAVHTDVLKEIGHIQERLGKIEGFDQRIEDVEEEQKDARTRQWWHSTLTVPAITALHAILNHFGIKV